MLELWDVNIGDFSCTSLSQLEEFRGAVSPESNVSQ